MTTKKDTADMPKLPEGCTPEMVKAWKIEYGEKFVKVQVCEDQDGYHEPFTIVTRVPGRRTMELFQKFIDRDPRKANDILLKECVKFGSEQFDGNDYKTLSAINAVAELIPTSKITTKNA